MDYPLQDGEVLFCGSCQQQFTTNKVNPNFTCQYCGNRVTSWYKHQTHQEALSTWQRINGKNNNIESNPFTSTFNSGMANNHIENQIELLAAAKDLFREHAEKIEDLRQSFASSVRMLEQEELNQDYMDFLEEFLGDYLIKLKTIRETIEDEYIPAVDRKMRYLEERD